MSFLTIWLRVEKLYVQWLVIFYSVRTPFWKITSAIDILRYFQEECIPPKNISVIHLCAKITLEYWPWHGALSPTPDAAIERYSTHRRRTSRRSVYSHRHVIGTKCANSLKYYHYLRTSEINNKFLYRQSGIRIFYERIPLISLLLDGQHKHTQIARTQM